MKLILITILAYFLMRAGQAKTSELIFQTSLSDLETEVLISEMPLLFNVDEIKFLDGRDVDVRIFDVRCEIKNAGIKNLGDEGFTVDDETFNQLEQCAQYAMETNEHGAHYWDELVKKNY